MRPPDRASQGFRHFRPRFPFVEPHHDQQPQFRRRHLAGDVPHVFTSHAQAGIQALEFFPDLIQADDRLLKAGTPRGPAEPDRVGARSAAARPCPAIPVVVFQTRYRGGNVRRTP